MKIFTLAVFLCLAMFCLGQAGTLNTQFAGGVLTTSFGTGHSMAEDIAVQPDGKIVAVGQTLISGVSHIALVRINTNGTLDNSFGTNGKLVITLNTTGSWLKAVTIQNDGKILAGGSMVNGSQVDFVLLRLLSDGSFDPAFGTSGMVTANVDLYSYLNDLLIQPDGRIVVAGEAADLSSSDYVVARYLSNGTPDLSFSGGFVITDVLGDDYVKSVRLMQGGKIIAGGSSSYLFSMIKLNSNGTLDESFGNGGTVTTAMGSLPGNDNLLSIELQADGKIIAVGEGTNAQTSSDFVVARYTVNGQLDNAFANNGRYIADINGNFDQASSVAILNNGKILISGNTNSGGQQRLFVARLTQAGIPDAGFGSGGQTILTIGSEAYAYAMALNGLNIYIAGVEMNAPNKMMIASLTNDAIPLPVRFSSFTVQKQGSQVLLKWQTELEEGTKIFIAEKSRDGKNFSAFAEVKATGNSTSPAEYRTIDPAPFSDITYYRIQSVDHDGSLSYTKVLSIKTGLKQIEIVPNPVRSFSQVQLPGGINDNLKIEVYDMNGRTVRSSQFSLNGNALSFSINMSDLKAGTYLIKINGGKINFSQKVVKE